MTWRVCLDAQKPLASEILNSILHQSTHGFATRVYGFATKTKALAREIQPATQAIETTNYHV